jgi:hypothetical protein
VKRGGGWQGLEQSLGSMELGVLEVGVVHAVLDTLALQTGIAHL